MQILTTSFGFYNYLSLGHNEIRNQSLISAQTFQFVIHFYNILFEMIKM